jgi:glycosyltransferase involved in cell wall biosynthesis
MNKLSVVVITKNEEKNIQRCLESVKWAGEIVIVDDNSTDSTVEIAKKYTQKIYIYDSTGKFFDDNKNVGINKATGDWILSLDADEVIPPALADEIETAIQSSSFAGYYLNRKNYFLGKWIKGCDWYPDYILRLFKKGACRWPSGIHKAPQLKNGKAGRLKNHFIHYSYSSLEQYFNKFNQYTNLSALQEFKRGFRLNYGNILICFFLKPLYYFIKKYFLKLGIRDGFRGFFISFSSALTVFVSYAKLWEMQNRVPKNN